MNFQENIQLNFSNFNFFQKIIVVNIMLFIIYQLSYVFKFQDDIISFFSLDVCAKNHSSGALLITISGIGLL